MNKEVSFKDLSPWLKTLMVYISISFIWTMIVIMSTIIILIIG